MEFILIVAGLIMLIWVMSMLGRWLFDMDTVVTWPYPVMGFQEQMMDEVAIMRENQKEAIATRKLMRRYETRMMREQEAGHRRAVAISQAYVRKVREITRS